MKTAAHRAAILGCLGACHCWLVPPDPVDPLPPSQCQSCDGEAEFELDPTCELTGELVVEIGEGTDEFLPLMPGDAPEYYAGPQGGGHYYASVRISGVDVERYDVLQLVLDGYYQPCEDESAPCPRGDFQQVLVLGGEDGFIVEEGAVEEHGIIMPIPGASMIQAQVLDPCGRSGWAQHRW